MNGKPWLKLWTDMLDDPKIGLLPDRLKWRFVQCLLLAALEGKSGKLPPLAHLAYRLRLVEDVAEADLTDLASAGLLDRRDGNLFVARWEERQRPMTATERSQWRRSQQKHGDATNAQRTRNENAPESEEEEDSEGEEEVEAEVAGGGFGVVVQAWESAAGPITAMIAEQLADLASEAESHRSTLPAESEGGRADGNSWMCEAIREAAGSAKGGRVTLRFVQAILERWLREGFKSPFRPAERSQSEIDSWLEERRGK